MALLRKTLALAFAAAAVAPAAAQAAPQAQPLVDAAPFAAKFKDRVFASSKTVARAAATSKFLIYTAPDGVNVSVGISDQYGNSLSQTVAQSYVDFLDSLDHGPELSTLKIYIAPPSEVLADCGGVEGTLACYDSGTDIMTVPGGQLDTGGSGVTTAYVVAHEYGHHIAAARSNAPFRAFAFGPKYWASYERVCDKTANGLLFPGNEAEAYGSNPGESWAETYAQLKYPDVAWQYTPLLQPDEGAFAAARKDVLQPWTGPVTKTFKGSFAKRGSNAKSFLFSLNLDGAIGIKLTGPSKTNYNLWVSSNGQQAGHSTASGSRDSLSYSAACRQTALERVRVLVRRVKGSGPFTLRVQYAG